ncbi:hypothetical protein NF867_11045 [Solitalea sp. MAHUQ-68]|uniref:Uncharacterized protein n=1 Tax=Solitalea agri TaxID=2953739 RepID=A0A9X2F2D0_9SPHI|nr:hypothetical protein [Solitalea agri]MCO4293402.1 hypothetical protein [Solitalea agri]
MENKVSLNIAPADLTAIKSAMQVLTEKLGPHLLELKNNEARELPKMGDKSLAFVTKAYEYAKQHPEFAHFLDVTEFEKDTVAVQALRELLTPLAQLHQKLEDTMLLAGSEAYTAALTYYGSVKEGNKRNVPNSKIIYDDLSLRFPGRTKAKEAKKDQ